MIILSKAVIFPGESEFRRKLRLYFAERSDPWTGFICAERGWDGTGLLPSVPATTEWAAIALWLRQVKRWERKSVG